MLHDVTCHVTVVSHTFFIVQKKNKIKEKENQSKIRKIKEKKIEIVNVPVSHNTREYGGRDGIVKETPVHVYYAYLKPTWGYGFNSLVVLYVR